MRVAAVDLGASSGRVMAVDVTPAGVGLTEVHRFGNGPVRLGATLHWDVLALYRGVLDGLRAAGSTGPVASVGIDSWAVDHGLLDATGALLGNPVHYRDARTRGVPDAVHALVPAAELYATTGVQVLAFNTIYQLAAAAGTPQLGAAQQLLLIPDLLGYWLTGTRVAEVTNASTTGLLDVRARAWSTEVMKRAGIEPGLFAPLVEAGARVGELAGHVLAATGLPGPVPLVAVGSHDTASAVVGIPAATERFAYVATGTWSLVGVELAAPVLTEASRAANFSNELGVDGTVRYLRNVMGLWLLQECLRAWGDPELGPLLDAAAGEPGLAAVVDAGDPEFLPPGDMPARIAAACARTGQRPPATRAAIVRCILDSLALAHRRIVREAVALSGRDVDVVHVVGGGARNALLCRLTADACGLPVVAGPVEAAAYGNALVQARALGVLPGGLAELRGVLRTGIDLARYEPVGSEAAWDEAAARLG
ncbi:MAG: rhamnulokinase family protein [Pseudonocardia sp.]